MQATGKSDSSISSAGSLTSFGRVSQASRMSSYTLGVGPLFSKGTDSDPATQGSFEFPATEVCT